MLTDTMKAIAAELQQLGFNAGLYHSGGGVWGVAVSPRGEDLDNHRVFIGCHWGWSADLYDESGQWAGSVGFDDNEIHASDSARDVAQTLVDAVLAEQLAQPLIKC